MRVKPPILLLTCTLVAMPAARAQETIETAPIEDGIPLRADKRSITVPVSIDRDDHELQRYALRDVERIAEEYRREGMRWFYRRHTPELFYPYLDENLIPLVSYNFGKRRNPVMTSQAALAFYTSYVEAGARVDSLGFMNNVDWLLDHHDDYYLRYDFPWRHGGRSLDSGWVSAMAQGEALAAVSSAYHLTGEQKYWDAARGFFKTLHTNTETTWTVRVDDRNYYWLEEYPNADLCRVLKRNAVWLVGSVGLLRDHEGRIRARFIQCRSEIDS